MKILDKTSTLPALRPSLRTCAALAASLAILAAPAAARADEPSPAEIPAAPPPADPAARSILVLHDHDDGGASGPTRARNVGLLAGGLAMAAVGLASAIAGGAFLSAPQPPPPAACSSGNGASIPGFGTLCALGTAFQGFNGKEVAGYSLAVGGAGLMAGGLAMALVGGWQVPIATPTRAQQTAGVPAVTVGAQKATLTWTF